MERSRILVVDADPERRERVTRLLADAGLDADVASDLADALIAAVRADIRSGDVVTRPTLAELERRYARRILAELRGNKTRAAEVLGIDRKTLYRLVEPPAPRPQAPRSVGEEPGREDPGPGEDPRR